MNSNNRIQLLKFKTQLLLTVIAFFRTNGNLNTMYDYNISVSTAITTTTTTTATATTTTK